MKKIIRFTKLRFIFLSISALVIAGGIAGTVLHGGFDLGIDFNAGLNQRVQIAPLGFVLSYEGEDQVTANVINEAVTFEIRTESGVEHYRFPFQDYETLRSIASAITEIPGVSIELMVEGVTPTNEVLGMNHPVILNDEPAKVNLVPRNGGIPIDEFRGVLSAELGRVQVQTVGAPEDQEFMVRVEDTGEDKEFSINASNKITELLSAKYGADQVIVKQTDFVGPRFSSNLGQQSFTLTLLALVLILVYIWIRFKLAYAVSAISALLHDVLIMLGFLGTFQMEISTATIAAVLTIIGYSLNDTIVIFDRIRENAVIMNDRNFKDVIDTSVTQSLSRTLITSLTTLLAAASLFVFGTGSIKDFALALIVGIVVGTYSSIFVASPILLAWTNASKKRQKKKEIERFGGAGESKKPETVEDESPKQVEIPKMERKLKGKRQKKRK